MYIDFNSKCKDFFIYVFMNIEYVCVQIDERVVDVFLWLFIAIGGTNETKRVSNLLSMHQLEVSSWWEIF